MSDKKWGLEGKSITLDGELILLKVETYWWLGNHTHAHFNISPNERPEKCSVELDTLYDFVETIENKFSLTEKEKLLIEEKVESLMSDISWGYQQIRGQDTEYDYEKAFDYHSEFNDNCDFVKDGRYDCDSEKIFALAMQLDLNLSEIADIKIEVNRYCTDIFKYGKQEYNVLDDTEADTEERERVENVIDECYIAEFINDEKKVVEVILY